MFVFNFKYTLDGGEFNANILASTQQEAIDLLQKTIRKPFHLHTIGISVDGIHAITNSCRRIIAAPIVSELMKELKEQNTIKEVEEIKNKTEKEGTFQCSHCEFKAKTKAGLILHLKNKHNIVETKEERNKDKIIF